jgi:hypothetical protein
VGLWAYCVPAAAQVFVSALGGSAALSGASVIRATPPAAANYDPKVGPAVQIAVGYHFNDWVSAQTGYSWNRNLVTTRQLAGTVFSQSEQLRAEHAVAFEAMLYFRPRASRLRPYLSAGPSVVSLLKQRTAGLRVAVGIDIALRGGWGVRYNFSEMVSANPFAQALNPPAGGKLMNFQNLFGVVKRF